VRSLLTRGAATLARGSFVCYLGNFFDSRQSCAELLAVNLHVYGLDIVYKHYLKF